MQDGWYDDRPQSFQVYAPCRTAVVYALVDDDQPLEIESAFVDDDQPIEIEIESTEGF